MKYKAGDKVRVRKDLEIGGFYQDVYFYGDRAEFAGKILTIKQHDCNENYSVYENNLTWSSMMLEPVTEITEKVLLELKDDEIKRLKKELKSKELKISYLEGQVYAYEKTLAKNNTSVGLNGHIPETKKNSSYLECVAEIPPHMYPL